MELEQSTEETERTLYLVGGSRHGDEVTIPTTQQSYLDLATAQTYYLKMFVKPINGPLGVPNRALVRPVLIHESYRKGRNPAEVMHFERQSQLALADIVMSKWFAEGDEVPMDTKFVPGPSAQNGDGPDGN